MKVTLSYLTLCDPVECSQPGFSVHWNSPGKYTGVDSHSLLRGIFLIQGSNLGLLHCRQILYCLSHQGKVLYVYARQSRSGPGEQAESCKTPQGKGDLVEMQSSGAEVSIGIRMGLWGIPASTRDRKDYLEKLIKKTL